MDLPFSESDARRVQAIAERAACLSCSEMLKQSDLCTPILRAFLWSAFFSYLLGVAASALDDDSFSMVIDSINPRRTNDEDTLQ